MRRKRTSPRGLITIRIQLSTVEIPLEEISYQARDDVAVFLEREVTGVEKVKLEVL